MVSRRRFDTVVSVDQALLRVLDVDERAGGPSVWILRALAVFRALAEPVGGVAAQAIRQTYSYRWLIMSGSLTATFP